MSSPASFKTTIKSVVSSRYGNSFPEGQARPDNWDERVEGIDVVKTECGKTLSLLSDGGQSVPQPGWVILVNPGSNQSGDRWTLFGMPKGSTVRAD